MYILTTRCECRFLFIDIDCGTSKKKNYNIYILKPQIIAAIVFLCGPFIEIYERTKRILIYWQQIMGQIYMGICLCFFFTIYVYYSLLK